MNKNNLCYCILSLQYIKCHCVAGYLLQVIIIILIQPVKKKKNVADAGKQRPIILSAVGQIITYVLSPTFPAATDLATIIEKMSKPKVQDSQEVPVSHSRSSATQIRPRLYCVAEADCRTLQCWRLRPSKRDAS